MKKTNLVDELHPIKESFYKNMKFINIKTTNNKDILIEEETYKGYLKLKEYLNSKKITIDIINGYEISSDIDKKDEINTGFTIEVDTSSDISNYLSEFGFIKRKNNRIRYTGCFISKILKEFNMNLEEYVENFSGVIVIDKKSGMTSFDVVNEISHLFGIKRVGHTGTLDPLAEGVLIIAIGKATKIVELLTAKEKEYIAGVKLGIRTDTKDIEGTIISKKEVPENIPLEEVLSSYKKTYMQEVPIYSAVKVNGKKLYEYARNNIEVSLPKKEVTIKEISLINKEKDTFTFKTLVSKGTYIRSLIDDIGISLNTYATMTSLKRTKQGKVTITDASTLEDIKNNNFKIHKIEEVLDYPVIEIEKSLLKYITNGRRIDNNWNITDKVIFTYNNKLLGIYEIDNNELKVWKNFTN